MRRRHVRFLVLDQPRRPGSTGANVGFMVKLATDVLGQKRVHPTVCCRVVQPAGVYPISHPD